MSKYIIDTGDYLFTTDGVLVVGFDCDNKPATFYNSLDNLEELNSDYINEHFGDLQDTAYQKGLEDGKAQREHDDKIEVGDEVTHKSDSITWTAVVTQNVDGILTLMGKTGAIAEGYDEKCFVKTGRHFDIASILEAMKA